MTYNTVKRIVVTFTCLFVGISFASAMPFSLDREAMIKFTPQWEGERFPNGRPKVSDSILERMKLVDIEAAWVVLRNEGYEYQFEEGWEHVHPGEVLCGRAMTAMYMPLRKDVNEVVDAQAEVDGHAGGQVTWPIDMLQQGDVYVADVYNNQNDGGPIIGASLGTTIFANSGNGVLFNGVARGLGPMGKKEGANG
ncbi:MAG: RraA family protein, partial [Verrucomicrobiia bacterium]